MIVRRFCSNGETVWIGQLGGRVGPADQAQLCVAPARTQVRMKSFLPNVIFDAAGQVRNRRPPPSTIGSYI